MLTQRFVWTTDTAGLPEVLCEYAWLLGRRPVFFNPRRSCKLRNETPCISVTMTWPGDESSPLLSHSNCQVKRKWHSHMPFGRGGGGLTVFHIRNFVLKLYSLKLWHQKIIINFTTFFTPFAIRHKAFPCPSITITLIWTTGIHYILYFNCLLMCIPVTARSKAHRPNTVLMGSSPSRMHGCKSVFCDAVLCKHELCNGPTVHSESSEECFGRV
jgi:hypothetical protein